MYLALSPFYDKITTARSDYARLTGPNTQKMSAAANKTRQPPSADQTNIERKPVATKAATEINPEKINIKWR
jgi:hypothetical protein